jgi:hypothetical protein
LVSASPSHEAIAEAAGCARSTVYEAIRALEQVGILSWVNRIKRVREYVPGLFGNPVQRRCAEPRSLAARRRRSPTRWCGNGQIQTARTAASATRCNDVAPIGQFNVTPFRLRGRFSLVAFDDDLRFTLGHQPAALIHFFGQLSKLLKLSWPNI